jgi:hypothetical protein
MRTPLGLVAGAGLTGMTMAIELKRAGRRKRSCWYTGRIRRLPSHDCEGRQIACVCTNGWVIDSRRNLETKRFRRFEICGAFDRLQGPEEERFPLEKRWGLEWPQQPMPRALSVRIQWSRPRSTRVNPCHAREGMTTHPEPARYPRIRTQLYGQTNPLSRPAPQTNPPTDPQ